GIRDFHVTGVQTCALPICVLRELDAHYGNRIHTRVSTPAVLDELLPQCDLLIGAVLVPGAAAPKLLRRAHLARMRRGAVIVDVEIGRAAGRERVERWVVSL